jgi:hypothetical protein
LGIDPETDVRTLVLAWKLKSKERPGEIKLEEFIEGMQEIGVNSVAGLKSIIPSVNSIHH